MVDWSMNHDSWGMTRQPFPKKNLQIQHRSMKTLRRRMQRTIARDKERTYFEIAVTSRGVLKVEEMMSGAWRPSREQIQSSLGKTVPDLIAPRLKVLFSGINPSLYSAAVGHHFARPGNRFWPVLHAARFTPRLFTPFEGQALVELGYGITNFVSRATSTAAEISDREFVEGGQILEQKVLENDPKIVAFLGITAYRSAFGRPRATVGLQPETLSRTRLWLLPNPSGLNDHYSLRELAKLFEELRQASELPARES